MERHENNGGPPGSSPVIVASGLSKRYGRFTAVDDLNLIVGKGEIFGLLGPNGAGKTTTILMLLGLTEPTAGTVSVCGCDPVRDPLTVKSFVGYLPDNVGFYPNMTGRQNLRYTASLNGIPRKEADERIAALLEEVGLTYAADKRAGTYSRGMRQRLAVADALVKRPSILILDEPTIGIDPEGVRELLAMLSRLRDQEGMTILLSSHLLHQVQEVCDRVGIFVGGHLIAAGPVEVLERQLSAGAEMEIELAVTTPEGDAVGGAQSGEIIRSLEAFPGVTGAVAERDLFVVRSERDVRADAVRWLVDRGLLPVHVRQRGLTLDDIYDRYFQGEVESSHGRK
jgi:ABC-2 type transport system ATP-binding protein